MMDWTLDLAAAQVNIPHKCFHIDLPYIIIIIIIIIIKY